jgi:hypothetical protein
VDAVSTSDKSTLQPWHEAAAAWLAENSNGKLCGDQPPYVVDRLANWVRAALAERDDLRRQIQDIRGVQSIEARRAITERDAALGKLAEAEKRLAIAHGTIARQKARLAR